ncbi:MAG TPA: alginate lyase family protein [Vicinamibacterales bacterium]
MSVGVVQRALAMSGEELRFRLKCQARKIAQRARLTVAPPRWRRDTYRMLLRQGAAPESIAAASRGAWSEAHRALAAHIASRDTAFPLVPAHLPELVARIAAAFPHAARDAAARADLVVEGSFDLLGYRSLSFGAPPRWTLDPVHGRTAPGGFWASVPYLDPQAGDHKIIWEINRHQHFLALGRAFHLTGDRRYYRTFVAHLEDWLQHNPPLQGVNWASMLELAFRALSWLWALHLFAPSAIADEDGAPPWTIDLLIALDRQLDHVEQNLSSYFSPNTHLSGEALALYVAGVCLPELRSSARRAAVGRAVLLTEASRQVRGDGGHAELSAHYHRYSTDFYLLACSVARDSGDAADAALHVAAQRQADYLRAIADDEGRLPLIGDDDGGQLFPICGRAPADCRDTLATAASLLSRPDLRSGPTPEETYWLTGSRADAGSLERAPLPGAPRLSADLRESGYYVMRGRPGDHLVFDAGPHGFLNGGHAHADALSIVLTAAGVPLLVDPGTATYTMDPAIRDRFRSTAMHNTVVINGRSQSEPKGPFHWHTRASARAPIWRAASTFDYVEGLHDGYAPIVHARSVLALRGVGWVIIDHLLGQGAATADAHWHIHPDWDVTPSGRGARLVHRTGARAALASSVAVDRASDDLNRYAPEYGRVEHAPCLCSHSTGTLPRSSATFIVMNAADVTVEPVAIRVPPPDGWYAAAFRLSWDDNTAELVCAIEHDGAVANPLAAPGIPWGTGTVLTNARVALFSSDVPEVLINGDVLASSVHQAEPGLAS